MRHQAMLLASAVVLALVLGLAAQGCGGSGGHGGGGNFTPSPSPSPSPTPFPSPSPTPLVLTVRILAGNNQSAQAGTSVSLLLQVAVTDQNGAIPSGVTTVTWDGTANIFGFIPTLSSNGSSFASVTADSAGTSNEGVTLGPSKGTCVVNVTATNAGVTSNQVQFSETAQ